jgi:hypothetical protein
VGDVDHGAPVHEGAERPADLAGAERVEVRGRLVQQQQRRVPQEGTGDRDLLPLAGDSRSPRSPSRVS